MTKTAVKRGVTNEKIFGLLLDMDEKIEKIDGRIGNIEESMATKADLREYATKNDLERVKDEILDVIKPISAAQDKDSETLVNHGKRIVVLERKAGIAVK